MDRALVDLVVDTVVLIICIIQTAIIVASRKEIDRSHNEIRDLRHLLIDAGKLISEETKRKMKHSSALDRLTDPNSILEDMERTADVIETRQANRLYAPRPDAGPPAKIHRPRIRSRLPRTWNPPRP
jgi:hypothetical protein